MFTFILSATLFLFGLIHTFKPFLTNIFGLPAVIGKVFGGVVGFLGVMAFVSLSIVYVDGDNIATKNRIYLGSDLPKGRIIGLNTKEHTQKGPQADIIGPGFHFVPFINFIYDIDSTHSVFVVPEGKYAVLVAKDGVPLRDNQFMADKWPDAHKEQMLDGTFFLTNGGQKGPQLDVLKPGKYRFNPYLFEMALANAVDVPTGNVAVIRSNVQTVPDSECAPVDIAGETGGSVATPIVPNNCIGVWKDPLMPGRYYLNNRAFITTIIPTRLVTWKYQGGYTKRNIDLVVNDDGTITQEASSKEIKSPKDAADEAITIRAEGWEFPIEIRAVVQVHPKNAPIVVASVGNLQKVEDNIATPTIRDIMRTIGGSKDTKVMDFVEKRDEIVAKAEAIVAREAAKAGVTLQELRLGEAAIPPELMVATLREQLAGQIKDAYIEEQKTQEERIKVEKQRATAEQQPILVAAEMSKEAAKFTKEREKLLGEGERDKLTAIAQGQERQMEVLGADRVMQLKMFEMALAAATENPDIVKVPQSLVTVTGMSDTGRESAAAILGNSNLVRGQMTPLPVAD